MLDFRFLLGAVIVFVLTVLAGLRIFGATEPLLATMGDQPRVEAVALPRHVPTAMPNVPKAAKADRPFVRPAAIEVPASVNDVAETIPREPPMQITGSVEPAPAQEIQETPRPRPKPRQAAQHNKEEVTGSVEPVQRQEIDEASKPRPKRRPVAQPRKKEPEAAKTFPFFFPFTSQTK